MATSKGRRAGPSGTDTDSMRDVAGQSTPRSRNNRTGDKTTDDITSTHNMDPVLDDADLEDDVPADYDMDEGDSELDWDDSMPARGGGKTPDR